MGPSLRDVDWIYGDRDAQMFSSIAEGRAHGMPSWQPRLTADQIWKLVTYIKSLRTRNEPQPAAHRIKDTPCFASLVVALRRCRRCRRACRLLERLVPSSPAETQPGAAADLNQPPQAGGAQRRAAAICRPRRT